METESGKKKIKKMKFCSRPKPLCEMPNVSRLLGGEVGETGRHPAADDEHVARHHGFEIHEPDAQGLVPCVIRVLARLEASARGVHSFVVHSFAQKDFTNVVVLVYDRRSYICTVAKPFRL